MWRKTQKRVNLELAKLHERQDFYRTLLTLLEEERHCELVWSDSAQMLWSFYKYSFVPGITDIFKHIALEIDHSLPSSDDLFWALWHQMRQPSDRRPAVISDNLLLGIGEYWSIRDRVRCASGEARWRAMYELVLHYEEMLRRLQAELEAFFAGAQMMDPT